MIITGVLLSIFPPIDFILVQWSVKVKFFITKLQPTLHFLKNSHRRIGTPNGYTIYGTYSTIPELPLQMFDVQILLNPIHPLEYTGIRYPPLGRWSIQTWTKLGVNSPLISPIVEPIL